MQRMRVAGKPQTIVYRVAILVSVAILPILAFSVFMIVREAEQARDRYLQQLEATTRASAQTIDVEIRRLQAIVETLREGPKLRERDLPGFYGFAKAAVAEQPGVRIALYDPSGGIVFATNLPFGERVPPTAIRPMVERVAATRRMMVSDLYIAAATRTPSLGILVPVVENDAVAFVLGVIFPPAYISQLLLGEALPNGVLGVVVDRNNIIIARTQDDAEYAGHPVSAATALSARDEGFYDGRTRKGQIIHGMFVRSRLAGWTVALAIPKSVLGAPLRQALWQFGGGGALLAACALAWAVYQTRQIAKPVAAVAAMADAMERGEPLPALRLDIAEAQVVADRLRGASETLREAAVERERLAEISLRDRDLSVFHAISSAAEQTIGLQERLQSLMRAIEDALGFEGAAIWLLDPSREMLTLRAEHNMPAEYAEADHTVRLAEVLPDTDAGSRYPMIGDIASHPVPLLRDILIRHGYRTTGRIPLVAEGRLVGLLGLADHRQRQLPPDEIALLGAIGQQMGAFIHHADLFETTRREIAERERLQAHLEDANSELEAFSYSVSHDLRAPLRAIDGFSRILQEDYADKLDTEGKRVIGVVRASTVRMTQMIDDILAFSRAGSTELKAADVDMQAAVRTAIRDLEPAAAGRSMDFVIGELPPAYGDAPMLQQVWANLLGNAVKYTAPRDQAIIRIGAEVSDGETVYFVSDNGVGFDMQFADKLFGAFQRLHGAEFPGSGIGLSIVRRIITRHRGRVWAQSEVDNGATFFFSVGAKETNGNPTITSNGATRRSRVPEPAMPG